MVFLDSRCSNNWTAQDYTKNLLEMIREWRAKSARIVCMTDEYVGQDTMPWQSFLRNAFVTAKVEMPEYIEFRRQRRWGDKVRRQVETAALWKQGKVKLVDDTSHLDKLIDQMTKIGKAKHDDFADAACDVFEDGVYQAMSRLAPESNATTSNPFDDILKPGPRRVEAAEKIAEMYAAQEALVGRFDVVQAE